MIRPLGARVLVRPIVVPASEIIALVGDSYPQIADVVAVGTPRCPDCAAPVDPQITSGARVALNPLAIVQETEVNGETLWMVNLDDVIGEIEPEPLIRYPLGMPMPVHGEETY